MIVYGKKIKEKVYLKKQTKNRFFKVSKFKKINKFWQQVNNPYD